MNNEVKESVAAAAPLKQPIPDQFSMPYWGIPIFLIVVFVILKVFIYIKDDKRHGK
ncbi:MAG: hypothetical protein ACPGJV_03370 [Bacteriovoracaceae bacterium]